MQQLDFLLTAYMRINKQHRESAELNYLSKENSLW